MTLRRLAYAATLTLIWCNVSKSLLAERITFEVSVGAKACSIVNIPRRWTVPDSKSLELWGHFELSYEDDFDFRRPEVSEPEILVTVARTRTARVGKDRLYSSDHYALYPGHRSRVRPASQKEWEQAEPLLMFRFQAGNELAGEVPDNFTLKYKGKTFEKSGQHWLGFMGGGTDYASRLSADDRFVAVNSWSGVALSGAPLGEFGGSNYHGDYFVDIYSLETFNRVIVIKGTFGGLSPSEFVPRSFWLGKRYFVLPLKTDMTKLMFCDVTALER
jgi:hypothetical protein